VTQSNLGYLYGILLPPWRCHDDKPRFDPRPDFKDAHADEAKVSASNPQGGSQWTT